MDQSIKSAKGDISISNFQGRIRLRWRVEGDRYSLNLLFAYSTEHLHHATVTAAEIKLDILKGGFDSTLAKYKFKVDAPQKPIKKPVPPPQASSVGSLAEKFKEWVCQVKNVNIEHSIDYVSSP